MACELQEVLKVLTEEAAKYTAGTAKNKKLITAYKEGLAKLVDSVDMRLISPSEQQKPTKEPQTPKKSTTTQEAATKPSKQSIEQVEDTIDNIDDPYRDMTDEQLEEFDELAYKNTVDNQDVQREGKWSIGWVIGIKDVSKMTYSQLSESINKRVNTTKKFYKDGTYKIPKAFNTEKDLNTYVNKISEMVEEKAKRDIAELEVSKKERETLNNQIDILNKKRKKLFTDIANTVSIYNSTKELRDRLASLYSKRDALTEEIHTANKVMEEAFDEFRERVNYVNGVKYIKFIDINIDKKGGYSKAKRVLDGIQKYLDGAINTAKGLKKVLLKSAAYTVNLAIEAYRAVDSIVKKKNNLVKELVDTKNKIKEVNSLLNTEFGSNWSKAKNNMFSTFKEIKAISTELQRVKEIKKKAAYTRKALSESSGPKNSKRDTTQAYAEYVAANKSAPIIKTDDDKARYLSTYTIPTTLDQAIATKKATSRLANENYNDITRDTDDVAALPSKKQLDVLIDSMIQRTDTGNISDTTYAANPYIMLLKDKDGNNNYNTAMAVRLETDRYIEENLQSLVSLSMQDIQGIYGYDKDNWMNASVSELEGGIPYTIMVNRIARNIADSLGLAELVIPEHKEDGEIIPEVDYSELFDKVTKGLALVGVMDAINRGLLKEVVVKKETVLPDEVIKVVTYTAKLGDSWIKGKKPTIAVIDKLKEQLTTADTILDVLQEDRKVVLTEPKVRPEGNVKKRNDNITTGTPLTSNAIKTMEEQKWVVKEDEIKFMLELKEGVLEKLQGHSDENEEGIAKITAIGREGKNRQIKQDTDNLKELYKMMQEGELVDGAYFKWFLATNSRQMIDAGGKIDPQNIKLHRYAMILDNAIGTVDAINNPISELMFKMGIAQAFGHKIDKKNIQSSIDYADSVLTTEVMDKVESAMKAGENKLAVNKVEIEFEEISHAVSALVQGRKYIKANGKPFKTTMQVEVDGLTNGFGHKMLQFLTASNIADEMITADTFKWLAKAGIRVGTKEELNDMADALEKRDVVDSYLTLGDTLVPEGKESINDNITSKFRSDDRARENSKNNKMPKFITVRRERQFGSKSITLKEAKAKTDAFLAVMKPLRDMDKEGHPLSDFVRKLMKDPFMTFGYSAGFESMSNSVTSLLLEDILNIILEAELSNPKEKEFLRTFGVTNQKELDNIKLGIRTLTPASMMINTGTENNRSLLTTIQGLVSATYGDSIQTAVTKEFGGLMEVNRAIVSSSTVMYSMFRAAYDKEARDIFKKEAKDLTKNQSNKILEKLKSIIPVVKTPSSESYDDGLSLYRTEKTYSTNTSEFGDIRVYNSKLAGDTKSRRVNVERRVPTSPGAAIAAGFTQGQDAHGTARGITTTEKDGMNGKKDPAQQIFDAWVLGVAQASTISFVNKDFMELGFSKDWSQLKAAKEGVIRLNKGLKELYGEEYNNLIGEAREIHLMDMLGVMVNSDIATIDKNTLSVEDTIKQLQSLEDYMNLRKNDILGYNLTGEQFVFDKEHAFEYNGVIKLAEKHGASKASIKKVTADIATALREINENCK